MNARRSSGRTEEEWDDEQWLSAIRWSATLVESLEPLHRRIEQNDALRSATAAHPSWAARFFAGVVTDTVATFPDSDPWRDVRVVDGVAMVDGRRFGTMRDHLDLIPAISPDPSIDVALAAVIDDLDERAAVLIASAFSGRPIAEGYLGQYEDDPDSLFFVGSEAARVAVFRRRCLMGPLDAYAVDTCWWWGEQGYRLEVGETDEEQLDAFSEERVEMEKVPEDRYVPDRDWIDERLRDLNRGQH